MNTTEEPLRCRATNLINHDGGQRCRLAATIAGYCKRHARLHGVTKLCLECGVYHEPAKCRKPARTE
jgi:hypothetical protein